MKILDRIALILTTIGALTLGSYGIFRFDFLGWLCGGTDTVLSRVVCGIIGFSALWTATLLFRSRYNNNYTTAYNSYKD